MNRFTTAYLLLTALGLMMAVGLPTTATAQQIIYVSAEASGSNDGSTWANAYTDLQSALSQATAGDTIFLAKGVYIPHASDRDVSFEMVNEVKLFGGLAGTETNITEQSLSLRDFSRNASILSGDLNQDDTSGGDNSENTKRIVLFDNSSTGFNSNTLLDGFTITGANNDDSQGEGGGMFIQHGNTNNASPIIQNVIFQDNYATEGGGVYNDIVIASVSAVTNPTFKNVSFIGNRAVRGGAVGNGALNFDGLVYEVNPSFEECLFVNNQACFGGTFYSRAGTTTNAGSISISINKTTFYNNYSTLLDDGRNIWNNEQTGGGTITVSLTNVIMYDDATDPDTYFNDVGSNSVAYSIVKGSGGSANWALTHATDGGNNLDVDPDFANPDDSNFDLVEGSPALDAASDGANIGFYQGDGEVPVPLLSTSVSSLDFEDVKQDGTSTALSYEVTTKYLTGDLTITPPTDFQVSLSETEGYSTESIALSVSDGDTTVTVYARFSPTSQEEFSSAIVHSTAGTDPVELSVAGNSVPSFEIFPINNNPICITDVFVGDSATSQYNLRGKAIAGTGITLTAPDHFRLSLEEEGTFTSQLNLPLDEQGNIFETVYVEFMPEDEAEVLDSIQHSIPGFSEDVYLDVKGNGIFPPTITLSMDSFDFGRVPLNDVRSFSYTVSGQYLEEDIVIRSEDLVQVFISLSETDGFTTELSLTPDGEGNVAATTIYVELRVSEFNGRDVIAHETGSRLPVNLEWTAGIYDPSVPNVFIDGTLDDFGEVAVGAVSPWDSLLVEGLGLNEAISITSYNKDFQFSLTKEEGFASLNQLELAPDVQGTVPPTLLFVRFAPGSTGTKLGDFDITNGSSGRFITLNGEGVTGTLPNIVLEQQTNSFGGLDLGDQSIMRTTFSAESLTEALTITSESPDVEISLDGGNTYSQQASLEPTEGSILNTTINVRIRITEVGEFNKKLTFSSAGALTRTLWFRSTIREPSGPTVVLSIAELRFPDTQEGQTSAPLSYTFDAYQITGSLQINPADDFEISLSEDFATQGDIIVDPDSEGRITNQEIFVRFSPRTSGRKESQIIHLHEGFGVQSLDVSGTAVAADQPTISVSTTDLGDFGQVVLGEVSSSSFIYSVSGSNLTENVRIEATSGFQLSLSSDEDTFTDLIILNVAEGVLQQTQVFVRFSPTQTGFISGAITHSSGATQAQVALSGIGIMTTEPTIVVSRNQFPDLGVVDFGVDHSREPQSYTVSAFNLTEQLSIRPPSGFLIAVDGDAPIYGNNIVLAPTEDGSIAERTLLVQFAPATNGLFSGDILHESGALTERVAVSGEAIHNETEIITSTDALASFGQVLTGGISAQVLSYKLEGYQLTASIDILAPAGFEISFDQEEGFGQGLVAPINELGTVESTTIFVRFAPATLGDFSGDIRHTSGEQSNTVAVTGSGV
ncbi:MAG: hypothetical protein AAFQ98_16980, partial [Bacteroidota bacterium]